jgi:hypothetical protein
LWWHYDITVERQPVTIATFQVPGLDLDGSPQPPMSGCHQPSERLRGRVIPFAWFAQGLRLVDILIRSCPGRSDIFCRIRLGDAGSVLMYADNRRVDHLYGCAVPAPS